MRKQIWLRWALILVVVLFAAAAGFSRMLQGAAARRYLIAHLETSFGRPVDVGRFDFSLLNGAQLEADAVTVAEDPRFGNEYFLRADSLTAGLRWSALLAGRIEFGSVSLTRPSLNLVLDSQGRWNIEQWLPPVASSETGHATAAKAPTGSPSPERLDEININAGRIDFKKGTDKSEFALLDVSGGADQESPGRWRLDLEATPMRVGTELQQIGTLRLRGDIGGASARLQPADLNVTWQDVSLADALRLARRLDYGMRGTMDLDLTARVAPSNSQTAAAAAQPALWSVSASARLRGIHGWRLPPRDSDPSANVSAQAEWRLGESQVSVSKLLVEMANSHLEGSASVEWAHGLNPNLHIASSTLGLADVAAFYRALRPGVADDLTLEGALGVDATFGGWPLTLREGAIASPGGVLTASRLPAPLHIGAINASVSRGVLDFAPTEIAFTARGAQGTNGPASGPSASGNAFTLRGAMLPDASGTLRWPPLGNLGIDGDTPRVQDWALLMQDLAQPLTQGWVAAGGLSVSLRGVRAVYSKPAEWSGSADARGIVASLPFVNQPLRLVAAHEEITPAQRMLTLTSAQAFGAMWHGTVSRAGTGGPWSFDLWANTLDVADLDLWLGPRARTGLLAALGLVSNSETGQQIEQREAVISEVGARGRLRVGEIALAPVRLDNFDGDVELAGRSIVVHTAQAGFFGGKVNGSFEALLLAEPEYRFKGTFDRVDLASLGRSVPSLSSRFAGIASASMTLAAHGIGRGSLANSLEGAGQLTAHNAEMRGVDLSFVKSAAKPSAAPFVFASAQGSFRIKNGAIEAVNFALANGAQRFQADGHIDFSHLLTLRIRPMAPATKSQASVSADSFVLAGTVESPRLSLSGADAAAAPEKVSSSARR